MVTVDWSVWIMYVCITCNMDRFFNLWHNHYLYIPIKHSYLWLYMHIINVAWVSQVTHCKPILFIVVWHSLFLNIAASFLKLLSQFWPKLVCNITKGRKTNSVYTWSTPLRVKLKALKDNSAVFFNPEELAEKLDMYFNELVGLYQYCEICVPKVKMTATKVTLVTERHR